MRLAVLGVGLIGGSAGLAARERLGADVTGWDPDAEALGGALGCGALARAAGSVEEAVDGADVVLVAAPVGVLRETIEAALAAAGPDTVVTDTGSVKRGLPGDPRFVGGHPLAGSEHAGVAHAREDLFDGAPWFLTRSEERVEALVTGLGATSHVLDADTHDRWMALTSHLPHLIADALAELAADHDLPTGPSFRDVTRVAGANPPLWRDIRAANADHIDAALDAFVARLQRGRA